MIRRKSGTLQTSTVNIKRVDLCQNEQNRTDHHFINSIRYNNIYEYTSLDRTKRYGTSRDLKNRERLSLFEKEN